MNLKIKMSNVLFLDIETVPQTESWTEVSEITQELFAKKTAYQRKEDITAKEFMSVQESGQNLEKLSVFLLRILLVIKRKEIYVLHLLVETMKSRY